MERLRVVCVERVAVVQSERLPGLLVLGEIPAGGEFGLQRLLGERHEQKMMTLHEAHGVIERGEPEVTGMKWTETQEVGLRE